MKRKNKLWIMKAEELMIGDWVNIMVEGYDNPTQIKEIGPFWVKVTQDEKDYGVVLIEPIPITPKILEKNGFTGEMYAFCKINDEQWLEYYYHEHRLRKWWRGIDERNNHADVTEVTFECQCHYAHELQHALKLCGISKNIEL